jgi:hypothetical protein
MAGRLPVLQKLDSRPTMEFTKLTKYEDIAERSEILKID